MIDFGGDEILTKYHVRQAWNIFLNDAVCLIMMLLRDSYVVNDRKMILTNKSLHAFMSKRIQLHFVPSYFFQKNSDFPKFWKQQHLYWQLAIPLEEKYCIPHTLKDLETMMRRTVLITNMLSLWGQQTQQCGRMKMVEKIFFSDANDS